MCVCVQLQHVQLMNYVVQLQLFLMKNEDNINAKIDVILNTKEIVEWLSLL